MRVSSQTVLSAQTSDNGYATVQDMFGAGFDKWGTSIFTGASSVRGEAVGYSSAEASISSSPQLRFWNFLYKQKHTVDVSLRLSHQGQ
jgi:hypothetical protein